VQTETPKEVSTLWGAVLLMILALHTRYKFQVGIPLDMLWACHLATLLIAVACLARVYWLASIGLLFHLSLGIPAYLIDAIVTWSTTWTSILAHVFPSIVGLLIVRRYGYAKHNVAKTFLFVLLSQLLAYVATPPAQNVNLAFFVWEPVAAWFPSVWLYRLLNLLFACSLLLPVHLLLRRYPPKASDPSPE
jgi:DMSO reductase anchor subunit